MIEPNCKECGHDHNEDEEYGECMEQDCECRIDIRSVVGCVCNNCKSLTTWRDKLEDDGYMCDDCWKSELLEHPCEVCKKKSYYGGSSNTRCEDHKDLLSLEVWYSESSGSADMYKIIVDENTSVGYLKSLVCRRIGWEADKSDIRRYGGDNVGKVARFDVDKLVTDYVTYDFQRLELVKHNNRYGGSS